jgi:hypothetical protein
MAAAAAAAEQVRGLTACILQPHAQVVKLGTNSGLAAAAAAAAAAGAGQQVQGSGAYVLIGARQQN